VTSLMELYALKEKEEEDEPDASPVDIEAAGREDENERENEERPSNIPLRNPLCTILTRPSVETPQSLLATCAVSATCTTAAQPSTVNYNNASDSTYTNTSKEETSLWNLWKTKWDMPGIK
jgi:hypothetical protein